MKSLSNIRKVANQEHLVKASELFSNFTIPSETKLEYDELDECEADPEEIQEIGEPYGIADEIIEQARKEAEEIIQSARADAEIIKEQAYKEGRQEGEKAGTKEAYEEHRKHLDGEIRELQRNIADIVMSVTRKKDFILEKYMDDLKNLVLVISEKIIQTSIKSSGEIIKRMILSSTDKMKKRQWAKIYIPKCNTSLTIEGDTEFLEELSHLSDNVKVIMMNNSEEGTCIIELPDEIVDASVSTQLENIKDILNNAKL